MIARTHLRSGLTFNALRPYAGPFPVEGGTYKNVGTKLTGEGSLIIRGGPTSSANAVDPGDAGREDWRRNYPIVTPQKLPCQAIVIARHYSRGEVYVFTQAAAAHPEVRPGQRWVAAFGCFTSGNNARKEEAMASLHTSLPDQKPEGFLTAGLTKHSVEQPSKPLFPLNGVFDSASVGRHGRPAHESEV